MEEAKQEIKRQIFVIARSLERTTSASETGLYTRGLAKLCQMLVNLLEVERLLLDAEKRDENEKQ